MNGLALARWQFAITTVYHFFFVPLTLGLAILVAIMETRYVMTGDETWRRMTKFWGKLFIINFAMGVVTGIVQEFQFGMNWSAYSRFVGDIFGAPLAIEALLAFFLESTFLGMWIFGWERLSKRVHLLAIWLVAIGSNISAFWILVANSWMQEPVGYVVRNGRAEMVDFGALLTNPHVWVQWPHVFFSGVATAGFFVLGISAYRLLRVRPAPVAVAAQSKGAAPKRRPLNQSSQGESEKRKAEISFFSRSFRVAAVASVIGAVMVGLVGHSQAQHMVQAQPMKMAAAEALWDTESPASMSLFTIGDMKERKDVFAIRLPDVLSILACNNTSCAVQGINDLQAEYEAKYGPGDYVPFVVLIYWSFRAMVGAGMLMLLLALYAIFRVLRDRVTSPRWFLRVLPFAIVLPFLANSAGWLMTEMGRQPWIVVGLMKTTDGVSPLVADSTVLASLVVFTLLYAALMVAEVYLLAKYARADTAEVAADVVPSWA
jgi:cytochrome d ubiquinol oxidase subunit I